MCDLYIKHAPTVSLVHQRYVYTNQEFLRLSYFDKIEGTGRADGQTDGMERLTRPPRAGRIIIYCPPRCPEEWYKTARLRFARQ